MIPRADRAIERGPGGPRAWTQAAELLAAAKFPVIVAGGGVVMSDGVERLTRARRTSQAPVVNTYLHNDSLPGRAIRSGAGRSAIRARRRR